MTFYPEAPPKFEVKLKTLASISHWGVFDLGDRGYLIRVVGEVETFVNGEYVETISWDTAAMSEIMRPVFE